MLVDWGSVPDWFAGAGAVAALLWARKAAIAASRTDQRQGEQLATWAVDRKRRQAESLAVWLDFQNKVYEEGSPSEWEWFFKIRNVSDLPIYELRAWARLTDRAGNSRFAFAWFRILPPMSDVIRVQAFSGTLGPLGAKRYNEPLRLVSFIFRDAGGVHWYRQESQLRELSADEYAVIVEKVDIAARRKDIVGD